MKSMYYLWVALGVSMARGIQKLSALQVDRTKKPGYYADGGGLYLQVTASGAKSWLFRFMLMSKAREMGLGSLRSLSLADARTAAADCRKQLMAGVDPIEARKTARAAANVAASRAFTFEQCANAYIDSHRAGWKNAKHADQWKNTLATYAFPVFGQLPVAAVDTSLVMKALNPIWTTKTETASRVRGRIESVIDWATTIGYRQGENPARWRGHLQNLLAKPSKIKKVEHHAALPYAEIGAFIAELRTQEGFAAKALEFCILTAARTNEVIGAQWPEFDLKAGTWIIPAGRMKAEREHRVPLPDRAIEILRNLNKQRLGAYVFPGLKVGKPLSNMAMLAVLERMKRDDLTVHGFRSTFRDWAAEQTNYPREVAEMALAHTVGDKVEAAYRRGDLFEKRRLIMADWARYCDTPAATADIIPMNSRPAA